MEEGKLLELIYSRMNTHIVEAWSAGTQAQVYESVADETGRPVESIRKIFEENDRNAGPFSIRRVREAKKRGGISEL